MATKLYRKYIAEDAAQQVNISGRVRVRIRAQLDVDQAQGQAQGGAGRLVFAAAQDEVFELMRGGRQAGTAP